MRNNAFIGMVVHSTPYSDIIFNNESEILQVIWKAKPTDAAFIETYMRGLTFVQEVSSVFLYCTDLTQIGPLDREQEAWLNNVFYGKLFAALQADTFVAVVFTEEHFKAIITNYTATEAAISHDFLLFNYFTSRVEAIQWLESLKKGQDNIVLPASVN